eukprot:208043-Pleurochrysis_carterae.AAC.1
MSPQARRVRRGGRRAEIRRRRGESGRLQFLMPYKWSGMCIAIVMWSVSGKAHKTACDNRGRSTSAQAPRGATPLAGRHTQAHDYKTFLHLRTHACISAG